MNALPAPLVPPNCDLRGSYWMPVNGHWLYGSDFYARAIQNPRGGLAAQKLWWIAWQQRPAGSLPNNEYALARFADFGPDMRGWNRARDTALFGFVLCSDGRWYHPVICEAALNAWSRRNKATEKKQVQRERAHEAGQAQPTAGQAAADRLPDGCQPVASRTSAEIVKSTKSPEFSLAVPRDVPAERRREERRNSDSPGESGADRSHRAVTPQHDLPSVLVVLDGGKTETVPVGVTAPETDAERIRRQLWSEGTAIVRRLAPAVSETAMRELIGWGAKQLGDGTRLIQVLRDVEAEFAQAEAAGDPIRRIRGFIHTRAGTSKVAKAAAAAAPASAMSHANRRIQELQAMRRAQ